MKFDLDDPRLEAAAAAAGLNPSGVRFTYAVVCGAIDGMRRRRSRRTVTPEIIAVSVAKAAVGAYGLAAAMVLDEEGLGSADRIGANVWALIRADLLTADDGDRPEDFDHPTLELTFQTILRTTMQTHLEALAPPGAKEETCR